MTHWTVHGRRTPYASSWLNVHLDDVELPDGRRIEHHVLSMPRPSVGMIVVDNAGNTLLIRRHRFIAGNWGWEVPAGWADPGEDLAQAARRETLEETGWTVTQIDLLTTYNPMSGISDMHYTAFIGTDPQPTAQPADHNETARIEWIPLDHIPNLAAAGEISDGPSLLILSYYLGIHRQLK